jgi:hypothetical protein
LNLVQYPFPLIKRDSNITPFGFAPEWPSSLNRAVWKTWDISITLQKLGPLKESGVKVTGFEEWSAGQAVEVGCRGIADGRSIFHWILYMMLELVWSNAIESVLQ